MSDFQVDWRIFFQKSLAYLIPQLQLYILLASNFSNKPFDSKNESQLKKFMRVYFSEYPHIHGFVNLIVIIIGIYIGSFQYVFTQLSAAVIIGTVVTCITNFYKSRNTTMLSVKLYARKLYKSNDILEPPSPPPFDILSQTLKLPIKLKKSKLISHENIKYLENGHEENILDIFYSEKVRNKGENRPVLIYIHGETVFGDKLGPKDNIPFLEYLAEKKGWIIVKLYYKTSLRYKNDPEDIDEAILFDRFSDKVKECKFALKYINDNIGKYYGNKDFVTISGSGIGATLAIILSVTQDTEPSKYFAIKERKNCKLFKNDLVKIKSVIAFSPLLGPIVVGKSSQDFTNIDSMEGKTILPLTTIIKDFNSQPPTFIIEPTLDIYSGSTLVRNFSLFCEKYGSLAGYYELPETHYGFETFDSMKSEYISWLLGLFVSLEYLNDTKKDS